MKVVNFRVLLDMFDTLSQTTIKAKKLDSACKIHITLAKNGKIFNIGEGCRATFNAKKSDGNFIYDNCTIEGDTIVYDFASSIDENGACQVSAVEGNVDCEVTLYNAQGEQLTSPRFTLFIDSVIYNGEEIISSPESDVLKGLINDAKDTIGELEDLIENGGFGGGGTGGGSGEDGFSYVPEVIRKSDTEITLRFHAMRNGEEDKSKTFSETITLPKGKDGKSGVHVGTEEPTDDSNVWINPEGIVEDHPEGGGTTHPLTFTGAVNATFDGSEAVSVEIPSGGDTDELLIDFTVEEEVTQIDIPISGMAKRINEANELKLFIHFRMPSADEGTNLGNVKASFYRAWDLGSFFGGIACAPTNAKNYMSETKIFSHIRKSKGSSGYMAISDYSLWKRNASSENGMYKAGEWEAVSDYDVLRIVSTLPIAVGTQIKLWARGQL